MKTVELTQGKRTLVDESDFEILSEHRWSFQGQGYAISRIKGKNILMHVFLMGKKKGLEIDHKNRDKLDNRRENLRHVTRSVNCFNTGLRSSNKSGFRGVSWDKRREKWRATIKMNYKQIFNKSFVTKEETIEAHHQAWRTFVEKDN